VLAGGTILSCFVERHWPKVYRVSVRLPDLPPALEGFTICQLSDFHRGPLVTEEDLRRAAALAMSLKAELIVLTGDYVSEWAGYAPSCAAALVPLSAPYGVWGILGNHDYWTDSKAVARAIQGNGVRMLVNQSARLQVKGAAWWLCGVDDAWGGDASLDKTLADVPGRDFKIVLWHEPDFAGETAKHGISLQLSGHSHGGQVTWPGGPPLIVPKYSHKYPRGLQRVEGSSTLVYTNVGLGVTSIPVRLNVPPEVSLLTLRKG
jgi:predicted MPP superfamily phosphohydrolase